VTGAPSTRRGNRRDRSPQRPAADLGLDATAVDGSDDVVADARVSPDTLSAPSVLPLYTPTEAARLLAVPESWLRRRVTARQAPHTVLGKHLRFSHADLVAIATAAARPAATAVPARRPRRGRGPRPTAGW
jgi:excisionase family DNA binding protein